jgi:predicted transcriptional regulator
MRTRTLYDLGDQQLAIVRIVWEHPGATVRQVKERLGGDLAYTSVLSAMQKLERLGWLRHEREPPRHVYHVTCSRQQAMLVATRRFIDRVFSGDPGSVAQLLGAVSSVPTRPSLKMLVEYRRSFGGRGRPA